MWVQQGMIFELNGVEKEDEAEEVFEEEVDNEGKDGGMSESEEVTHGRVARDCVPRRTHGGDSDVLFSAWGMRRRR